MFRVGGDGGGILVTLYGPGSSASSSLVQNVTIDISEVVLASNVALGGWHGHSRTLPFSVLQLSTTRCSLLICPIAQPAPSVRVLVALGVSCAVQLVMTSPSMRGR